MRRAAREPARQDAAHLVFRQPSKNGLADRMSHAARRSCDAAGLDPHRTPRLAHREGNYRVALHGREVHGLAGRAIDRFEVGLRAPRKVHLPARMAKVQDARPKRIEPAPHLCRETALHERRQEMVAGGNVQPISACESGKTALEAGGSQVSRGNRELG
jgi:hypothetical protein